MFTVCDKQGNKVTLKEITKDNRLQYKALKLAVLFNDGHIASYNEVLRIGKKGYIDIRLVLVWAGIITMIIGMAL